MSALGLGSGPRCFIRGCLHSTCTPVLFVLLSLRFLPGFFFIFYFYFFFLNFLPAQGFFCGRWVLVAPFRAKWPYSWLFDFFFIPCWLGGLGCTGGWAGGLGGRLGCFQVYQLGFVLGVLLGRWTQQFKGNHIVPGPRSSRSTLRGWAHRQDRQIITTIRKRIKKEG